MKIAGMQSVSMIDYPGKMAMTIFTPGCNYRCPACHAKKMVHAENLIEEMQIFKYLNGMSGWIDGLTICGGEPTLQGDLIDFIKRVKAKNVCVKLDTNGSNPKILEELLKSRAVDYVAMDIKGPKRLYPVITGADSDISKVEESMNLAQRFPSYEFRTTVVPIVRDSGISFMTDEEAEEMAKWVIRNTGKNSHKYFLQKFVARKKEEMVDERLSLEQLPEEMHQTPGKTMAKIYDAMQKYLPCIAVR